MTKSSNLRTKRAYEPPSRADGQRFLVDALWPRGLTKDALAVDAWLKDVAPSPKIRRAYKTNGGSWQDFRTAYQAELEASKPRGLETIRTAMRRGVVTLVFASRQPERNNATALRQFLEHEK